MIDTLLRSADPADGLEPDPDSPQAMALLGEILASPGVRPRRRRRRLLLAAVACAAAVAAGVVIPVLGQNGGGRAYAVTPQDSGAIRIEANWHRLHDLGELQQAIDAVGARTRIYVTGHAPLPSLPACAAAVPTPQELDAGPRVPRDAFQAPGTDDAHLLLIVRPRLLPPGATVVATFNYSQPDDHHASSSFFVILSAPPDNCAPRSQWFAPVPQR